MFTGRFYHTLDDRNRVTIPSRYRDELLSDPPVLTFGLDQNLLVLPLSYFKSIAESVNDLSLTDPEARALRRTFFSSAETPEMDKVGRIIISPEHREYAGINNEVVIVGNWDYFEIWSKELWSAQKDEIQNAQKNASRFIQLKISKK